MTAILTETSPEAALDHRIASPIHTIVMLVAIAGQAYRSAMRAILVNTATFDRSHVYERTILIEWLMFALMIVGVWFSRSPLSTVLGNRWRSIREAGRDLGIGIAFLAGSLVVMSMLGALLGNSGMNRAAQLLRPHGRAEIILWIVLSLSAGICEEAIFRGYLQRQFTALTKSAPLGILLSAVAFGGAHIYQGARGAIQISLLGAMLGVLAYWRKSVRPGMMAHALQDMLAIFAGH